MKTEWLNIIDKKVKGTLTIEEEKIWNELIQNPDFHNLYQQIAGIQEVFNIEDRKAKKAYLQQLSAKRKTKIRRFYWSLAVLLITITLAVVYFFTSNSDKDNSFDYVQYYEAPTNEIFPRFRKAKKTTKLEQAFRWYDRKVYDKAYALMKADSMSLTSKEIQFYTGVSALLSNQNEAAIKYLRPIAFSNHNRKLDATFYLSKAYLEKNNIDSAKLFLENVAQIHNSNQKASQKILDQIK